MGNTIFPQKKKKVKNHRFNRQHGKKAHDRDALKKKGGVRGGKRNLTNQ